jgi:hypothetical protein
VFHPSDCRIILKATYSSPAAEPKTLDEPIIYDIGPFYSMLRLSKSMFIFCLLSARNIGVRCPVRDLQINCSDSAGFNSFSFHSSIFAAVCRYR